MKCMAVMLNLASCSDSFLIFICVWRSCINLSNSSHYSFATVSVRVVQMPGLLVSDVCSDPVLVVLTVVLIFCVVP